MNRLVFVIFGLILGCSAGVEPTDSESTGTSRQASLSVLVTPQPLYAATYTQSTAAQPLSLKRTEAQFIADYNTRWNQGYRLASLSTHVMSGTVYYSGVWKPSTGGQFMGLGRNEANFIADYGTWWNNGFRLAALATYVIDGQLYYSGVWNPSTSGQFVGLNRTADQFVAEYGTQWNNGFKLLAFNSNVVGGQVRYTCVYNPNGAGQGVRIGQTINQLLADYGAFWNAGYRLGHLTSYVWNGVVYYGSVYNPSTAGQYLRVAYTSPDFSTDRTNLYNQGWRLSGLFADRVEMLDIGAMSDRVKAGFDGQSVGYSAALATASTWVSANGGLRRTAYDPPSRAWTSSARINMASVSKAITAIGVLQRLAARGMSIDAAIYPYLPSDWTLGSNVTTITFRELLTHTSGIRQTTPETYANLRTTIANGVILSNKTASYQNANFALFRIIIPYLNGFSEAGVTDKATATSTAYLSYMNQNVFAPAGLATVSMTPTTYEPSMIYPFPAGTVRGDTRGDWFTTGGGGGLQLSTYDLIAIMRKLRDGTLLSSSWQYVMDVNALGWDATGVLVRHGSYTSKGGGFPPQPNGGALSSVVMSFNTGLQAAAVINSPTTANLTQTIVDAYNSSWLAVY